MDMNIQTKNKISSVDSLLSLILPTASYNSDFDFNDLSDDDKFDLAFEAMIENKHPDDIFDYLDPMNLSLLARKIIDGDIDDKLFFSQKLAEHIQLAVVKAFGENVQEKINNI